MKANCNHLFISRPLIIIALFTLLSGCVAPGQIPVTILTNTPTIQPPYTQTIDPILTSTIPPTATATLTPTQTPTPKPSITCETNLAVWRDYPNIPNLISKIHSGEVAHALHEQHIFENLMQEKGVRLPFNPKVMLKPEWYISDSGNNLSFYYSFNDGDAINNPEVRNMWPVCGFLTKEGQNNWIIWAQAVPSKDTPDGYVFVFTTQLSPDDNINPSRYDAWVSKRLRQVNYWGLGGYFTVDYDFSITNSEEFFKKFPGCKQDIYCSWTPDVIEIIAYDRREDTVIHEWDETGYATKTIETLVRPGGIQIWGAKFSVEAPLPTPRPLTPYPTPTQVPPVSTEIMSNPSFENDTEWTLKTGSPYITGQFTDEWSSEGFMSYKLALHNKKGVGYSVKPGSQSSITQTVDLTNVSEILFDIRLYPYFPFENWKGGRKNMKAAIFIDEIQEYSDGEKGGGTRKDEKIIVDGKFQGRHDLTISMIAPSWLSGIEKSEEDIQSIYIDNIRFIYK